MNKKNYKIIFSKLLLISIPLVLWCVWQSSLAFNQYTFRTWEALITPKSSIFFKGPFYPNQTLSMTEVGDLAPYTSNAVSKQTIWNTDQYGYRNKSDLCRDPKIVIIGDSMAIGTSLTQSETFSEQLFNKTGQCTKSFAGGKIGDQANFIYSNKLHPNWVILVIAERMANTINELNTFGARGNSDFHFYSNYPLYIKWIHFRKNFYWNYRSAHGILSAIERSFKLPDEIQKSPNPQLLYFGDTESVENLSELEIIQLIKILDKFSESLEKNGAKLMVTFVPNKESIYPNESKNFGSHFRNSLKSGVVKFNYVDLLKIFKQEYEKNHSLLHHTDDTHWNALGVSVLVNEAEKLIQQ